MELTIAVYLYGDRIATIVGPFNDLQADLEHLWDVCDEKYDLTHDYESVQEWVCSLEIIPHYRDPKS